MASDLLENSVKETALGELPNDWEVLSLDELCSNGQGSIQCGPFGSQLHASDYKATGVPIVNPTHLGLNLILNTEIPLVSREDAERLEKHYLRPGDILIARRGDFSKFAHANHHHTGWLCGTGCMRVRVDDTRLNTEFLSHYFSTHQTQSYFKEKAVGTIMPNINGKILGALSVAVPPIGEQRAIAQILRTVQQAKAASEKVIAAARQLKQSLMRHLFTYGPVPVNEADKVPLKETEIGQIPKHWDVQRLEAVADLVSGGTPSKNRAAFWHGSVPWASPKDMKKPRLYDTEDHISQEAVEDGSRLMPSGSLFIVIRGMILAKDLPVALAMVPMAFNQDMKAILPKEEIDAEFLLYALTHHKSRLVPEIGTSAHGTKRIGTSAVNEFLLPVPPEAEQKLIALALACVDRKIVAEADRRHALDALFRSTLHMLMTGQVRMNHIKFPAVAEVAHDAR